MVPTLSTALILLAALINLLPVIGVVSASRLQGLYGIAFEDANLLILMQHRAILFGIVGGLLLVSAFHLPLRTVAVAVGLISTLSFILIAWLVGGYNAEIRRVLVVDVVASIALASSVLLDRSSGEIA